MIRPSPRLGLAGCVLSSCLRAADTPRYEEILKIDVHSHVFENLPGLHGLMRRIFKLDAAWARPR